MYADLTDVQMFIYNFRRRYGSLHPAFYDGTYTQANEPHRFMSDWSSCSKMLDIRQDRF